MPRDAKRGFGRGGAIAALLLSALLIAGCATRPVNAPVTAIDRQAGYRLATRPGLDPARENLVILAFSGGGTRAAAFSYGVLEALRDIELVGAHGRHGRALDAVDVITGVSGGSFTALAYGLYGEKLFGQYETRFLKRDVQGELIRQALDPTNWSALLSRGWGRSELAADLYDQILFDGATFADLERRRGPLIAVQATEIASGVRFGFNQQVFDMICSDLAGVRLSRAAAASSAVPFVLSPVTLNNYGGTCGYTLPPYLQGFTDPATTPRPAARAMRQIDDLRTLADSTRHPYLHLVDGGLADNLAMRGVLEVLDELEALYEKGIPTPLDHVRRIIVFIVNSLSDPQNDWDLSEQGPGTIELLIKATGVPIDHYSYDGVELLRDTIARWAKLRAIRARVAPEVKRDPVLADLLKVPDVDLYAIDVSFKALQDPAERAYLNDLPTSFVLPPEAVDRLRAAAGQIIRESPDFQRLLRDVGARVQTEAVAH